MGRKTVFNKITTPELLSQVNKDNIDIENDYLDYLRSVQRSKSTLVGYQNDIEIAWVWNLQHNDNIPFVDWKKRTVVKFQNWLINDNKNSPARVRRIKATLSSLSNYIENVLDDEYPDFRNIIHRVESPVNQPVRKKTILTDDDIGKLLHVLTKKGRYDQACAVALAVYSGRRKSELLRFRVNDFTDDRLVCNGALFKTHAIKTKGRGVDGKMLECFCLARKFKPYYDTWMDYRKKIGLESEWLFPSMNDPAKHISVGALNNWAERFSEILGIDFYWHALRHMTVTSFIRAGIPDSVIQQYIGWSDLSMVPVYSDISADEQLGMYFTEDGIKAPGNKSFSDIQ